MTKIEQAFSRGKAFIPFITAGDPSIEISEKYLLAMAAAGADILEIGVPFSDPIADGPVIERANIRALKAGANVDKVLEMCGRISAKIDTPLVLLTYLNPVFHMGYDIFLSKCVANGVSGLVVPDLPYEERSELSDIAEKHGIAIVPFIAPTSDRRIAGIAKSAAGGFLYVVSSLGITGVREEISTNLKGLIEAAKSENKNINCAVGFGISTPEQAAEICKVADGVIIGSACVKIIEDNGENAEEKLAKYVKSIKQAIS